MKPGDLVEWNHGNYRKRGIVIRKSQFFGWMIYFPTHKKSKFDHLGESALRKIQQLTEEK
jgi:hypothetical protein